MARGFADPAHLAKHGNRNGRPLGAVSTIQRLIKARDPRIPKLLDKAFDLAEKGDVAMLQFLLARYWPVPKPIAQLQPFHLPDTNQQISSLSELATYLIRAVASGQLAPDTADRLGRLVAIMNQLHEPNRLEDLLARVQALERERTPALDHAPSTVGDASDLAPSDLVKPSDLDPLDLGHGDE
jgi:hypothetical protein